MIFHADMTATELVFLARAVCDSQLGLAADPFQHFTVSVVHDHVQIVPVKS